MYKKLETTEASCIPSLKTAYNDNLGAADLWLPNYIGAIMLYDIVINNATYTNPIIYFFLNLQ